MRQAILSVAVMFGVIAPVGALAYTASGDRVFPSTILLPQLAPGDDAYFNANTLPLRSSGPGTPNRISTFGAAFSKTITDRFGVLIEDNYSRVDQVGAGTLSGFQNLEVELKYLAVTNMPGESLLALGLHRENGGTGAARVGAFRSGGTTPRVYFAKGLGDFDIGYLRPLAVTGFGGVQFADESPRPSLATTGFTLQYSIPYLQSKVRSFDLPEIIRGLTPMTEILITAPVGRSYGARTTTMIAPGVNYAGEGWEFTVEALLPATRATGTGVGVTARLNLAFDFLFPDTIGKPLFSTQ